MKKVGPSHARRGLLARRQRRQRTIAVDDQTIIQIDVNHVKDAENPEDLRVPVIDRLKEVLPVASDGKPRLSVLAITHHDTDHCCGFGRLIDEVQVDELWLTPRSFVEAKNARDGNGDKLTDAGREVYKEACRRRSCEIKAIARGEAGPRRRSSAHHRGPRPAQGRRLEGVPGEPGDNPGQSHPRGEH